MSRHRASLLLALFAGLALPPASRAADAGAEDAVRLDYAAGCGSCRTYRDHAPLALFSLGSLAVGGVFYGIHASSVGGPVSGDGSRMEMAVGAAGLTALAAGLAYLYYSLRGDVDVPESPGRDASLARPASREGMAGAPAGDAPAGPAAGAGLGISAGTGSGSGVSAVLVFPLSALLDG